MCNVLCVTVRPVCVLRYGTSDDIVLPHDCTKTRWHCYDSASFVVEEGITCELVAPQCPLPARMQSLAAAAHGLNAAAKEKKAMESGRPPLAGSLVIQGATADRAKFLNGIFEPTSELCNGMPVYRKKGEPGIWLEMVKTASGWRW